MSDLFRNEMLKGRNRHFFNIDISNWNVINVTDMSRMFDNTTFNRQINN